MSRSALLSILVAFTMSAACGSTSTSTSVAPSPTRCAVAAAASPATVPAGGGSGTLAVSSARECAWTVTSQADWIALVPPTEGQGDGSVRYTAKPNPSAAVRRGTLVLGSQTVDVTQEAARCRPELGRRSFDFASGEQTADVTVELPTGCDWAAKAGSSWITVVEGTKGSGAGRVRFRVSANAATTPRSGSLEVAGLRVDVRQRGSAPPPCTYTIDPASADAGPGPSDGSLSVQTDERCEWTAVSSEAWLTVVAGERGTGAGEVRYRAAANASTSGRTGRIAVNGSVFTLVQAPCNYSIDPVTESFQALGGTGRLDVRTEAPCPWSASSAQSWITVSHRSRSGDGRVDYAVAPNTGNARTGTITIGDQSFTVIQESATTVSGSVRNLEGSCPNKRFTVRGQRVRTTGATVYEGKTCGSVKNGVTVRVRGIVGNDGVLTASEVDF